MAGLSSYDNFDNDLSLPPTVMKIQDVPRQLTEAEVKAFGAAGSSAFAVTAGTGIFQLILSLILQAGLS